MNNNFLSEDEINALRSQTRGCKDIIHFNNAGSSLNPDVVIDTVVDYLQEEATYGGYETENKHYERIEDTYRFIAKLIGAEKEEIALFENASAAWQTAFKGLTFAEGDEIITSELEYVSNLIGLADIQKKGVKVVVINNDEHGDFPLGKLEAAISPHTKLIAVTHIPSSGGGMIPIEAIGKIAAKHKVLYMVDACQSAGQYPIDVKEIQCDILSATGRKYLRAPRGTGFLFVKKAIQDQLSPMLTDFLAASQVSLNGYTLRQDARRFELYEKSRALTLGLGKAAEYALNIGLDRIWQRVQGLAEYTRTALGNIPNVKVHDHGSEKCGIVTFSVDGFDSMVVKNKLVEHGINVSFGGAHATPLYMEKNQLQGIVRASFHYYNTEAEINKMCSYLMAIFGGGTM
ncbi:Selenocysteine lyase/Cysteine desulfurase [bacterium A37T11]|nr:Selenocysteine lyase/Cysteine desulfurase [bacterium A37T11]